MNSCAEYLFFLILLIPQTTTAQSFQPIVGTALELGGDRVGWITTEANGNQQIRGAQGISAVIGARFRSPALPKVMLDATVGYKYWRTFTDGAHVRLTRIPLHLTAHYWLNDNFRVGLGVLTDRRVRFRSDGLAEDHDFDPSFGTKLEVGWRNFALGYTRMRYYGATDRDRCAGGVGVTYLVAL